LRIAVPQQRVESGGSRREHRLLSSVIRALGEKSQSDEKPLAHLVSAIPKHQTFDDTPVYAPSGSLACFIFRFVHGPKRPLICVRSVQSVAGSCLCPTCGQTPIVQPPTSSHLCQSVQSVAGSPLCATCGQIPIVQPQLALICVNPCNLWLVPLSVQPVANPDRSVPQLALICVNPCNLWLVPVSA
jgi:hypothetical protein